MAESAQRRLAGEFECDISTLILVDMAEVTSLASKRW